MLLLLVLKKTRKREREVQQDLRRRVKRSEEKKVATLGGEGALACLALHCLHADRAQIWGSSSCGGGEGIMEHG